MTRSPLAPHLRAVGPTAVLAEVADPAAAASLAAFVRAAEDRGAGVGAQEVVPGAASVLLDGLEPGPAEDLVRRVAAILGDWRPEAAAPRGPEVTLDVVFDGPDLGGVADVWRTDTDEVRRRLTALTLTSAFCGFAPGFAYLAGLDPALAVPRLDSPRTRVPAGSVALADTWCGVYPTDSPGGWRLVGRTDAALWDADRDPPALLAPGVRVRLRDVT